MRPPIFSNGLQQPLIYCTLVCMLLLLGGQAHGQKQVVINEFMSSNRIVFADEDGDFEDWIELANRGSTVVDLGGWGLSDDEGSPLRWSIPKGTFIQPGGFLLIWASGKDRNGQHNQLHTNFSISASGEKLLLSSPSGDLIDSVPQVRLPSDVSFGRSYENSDTWGYFEQPTPGTGNITELLAEAIWETPHFSHEGGFYEADFELILEKDQKSQHLELIYTLDGSEPRLSEIGGTIFNYKDEYPQEPGDPFGPLLHSVRESSRYKEPLEIADRAEKPNWLAQRSTTYDRNPAAYIPLGPVFKGTVVRARLVKPGAVAGPIVTHTFFITPLGDGRYELPVISLTGNGESMIGYENGIYNAGITFDEMRVRNPSLPGLSLPTNYSRTGSVSERSLHFELFWPGIGRVESLNVGARVSGTGSRRFAQKSLKLYARPDPNGEKNSIDYPLFPGLVGRSTGKEVTSFKRLLLRAGGQDRPAKIRDALSQELIAHAGLDQQAYQPAVHFVNGEFWGITNIRESVDRFLIASHHRINPEEVVILKNNAEVESGMAGDRDQFLALRNYISNHDLAQPEHFDHVNSQIDIENFMIHHVLQIYLSNRDWPGNNIGFWRKKVDPSVPALPNTHDGRWRWIFYDLDFALVVPNDPTLENALTPDGTSWPNPGWSTVILRKLVDVPHFRNRFIQAFADHMATSFKPSRVIQFHDSIKARVNPLYSEHQDRWRNQGSINTDFIKAFGHNRPAAMKSQIMTRFGLSSTAPVAFDVKNQEGGILRINTIKIDNKTPGLENPSQPYPWTAEYFASVPLTIIAEPKPGFRFERWEEFPHETSASITILPELTPKLTAVFGQDVPPSLIHYWNFNDSDNLLSHSSSLGGALIDIVAGTSSLVTSDSGQEFSAENGRDADPAGSHLRVNDPIGTAITISLPTTNLRDPVLRYETRRSGQGAGTQIVSYTVDGVEYSIARTVTVSAETPELEEFSFAGIAGVDNNPNFAVRITFIQGGGGVTGNNRFDNITLDAIPLPTANLPPKIDFDQLTKLGSLSLQIEGDGFELDLSEVFSDPEGDDLSYEVTLHPPDLADGLVSGGVLAIRGRQAGNVWVELSATDGFNPAVATSFELLVYPAAHRLADGDYLFREWSSWSPAGTFPPSMVFLQGTEINDPPLGASLTRAYEIPASDAALPGDVVLPYAASNRTRINGLGDSGIAFINTGRGRDLGAAVLALDTRDVEQVAVSWLAGTMLPNSRVYGLRLQARVALEDEFVDVMIDGQPIEYLRNVTAGHSQVFGPLVLPEALLGRASVQLQWRYHHLAGTSGARAQLSLDDIVVTAGSPRSFDAWRLTEYPGLAERSDDLVSGPDAVSHSHPNLLRYALGAGRNADMRDFLPRAAYAGGFSLLFPFDPAKTDVRYRVLRDPSIPADAWAETVFDSATDSWDGWLAEGWLEVPDPDEPTLERAFYRLEISRE